MQQTPENEGKKQPSCWQGGRGHLTGLYWYPKFYKNDSSLVNFKNFGVDKPFPPTIFISRVFKLVGIWYWVLFPKSAR